MDIDWSGIVCKHGPAVFRVAWRVLGNESDAEDIVQEVFLEAQQSSGAANVENWGAFLRQIATFRSLDRLRRRKPTVMLDESVTEERSQSPEAIAMGNELQARLRAAIGQLSKQQAAVFCLRYFEDQTYEQIAKSLNVSTTAVSTTLNKARTKLKSLLGNPQEDHL